MKKNNLFEKIDIYFLEKKKSDTLLVGFMLGGIIAFLIYTYVFPLSESYYRSSLVQHRNITSKLTNEKDYVQINIQKNKIANLQQELNIIKDKLQSSKDKNNYIDKKLKKLSYLLFENKSWTNFLDRISKVAQENGVQIIKIISKTNKPDFNKVERMLNISVDLIGSFHGIMNFINTLEKNKIMVDINTIKLTSKEQIEGELNIIVWGIRY
ncbi:MAG: hypothetical protein CR967_01710 [Proteobacteria bacterium]|nr:MAG: hypothetical protein CR967_01710 [Pseudomonadota bacterium]